MKYTAIRPFAKDGPGNNLAEVGEVIEIKNERRAKDMQEKGLVWPHYSTKEDKRAQKIERKETKQKVTIKHDSGPMFFVMQGDTVVDRLTKAKAQKLRDKLNGVSS